MPLVLAILLQITTIQKHQVLMAANHFMPGITWRQSSALRGDFSCHGRREYAILGTSHSETVRPYIIVAIFLDGLNKQPEFVIDSVHVLKDAQLTLEDWGDLETLEERGIHIQDFQQRKTCKGLNIADDNTD